MSQDHSIQREEQLRKIREQRRFKNDPQKLFEGLRDGHIDALSKAITLVESSRHEDHELAASLLEKAIPFSGNAWRIGITGVPGVGKSTFIETFGKALTSKGHRVAVLAVDPSSQRSGGSILGDKTRMDELSKDENAFIRPSPAADSLGGVARSTRESIILCEAAGFDVILVETVGVGQSETTVYGMVDYFLLLMLAGAGDELQGIKRGIMEMADGILITKADGENAKACIKAKRQYMAALHLYPPSDKGWSPKVETCSALENTGISEFIDQLDAYFQTVKEHGWLEEHRKEQDLEWFHSALRYEILSRFIQPTLLTETEELVRAGKLSPFVAARQLALKVGK